jgi:CHAD domain-containing protein
VQPELPALFDVSADACLTRLRGHARAVLGHGEPEAVHQLRVCAARLRVWLKLAGIETLHDDLSWLRKAAEGVRDLDVQLEATPPAAMRRHLQQQRSVALHALQDCLRHERYGALMTALGALPAVPLPRAQSALQALAGRTLQLGQQRQWRHAALEPTKAGHGSIDALHRLRRSVRRVRYALNWLGGDAHAMTELQEALGDVCNGVMLLERQGSTTGSPKAYRQRL